MDSMPHSEVQNKSKKIQENNVQENQNLKSTNTENHPIAKVACHSKTSLQCHSA